MYSAIQHLYRIVFCESFGSIARSPVTFACLAQIDFSWLSKTHPPSIIFLDGFHGYQGLSSPHTFRTDTSAT